MTLSIYYMIKYSDKEDFLDANNFNDHDGMARLSKDIFDSIRNWINDIENSIKCLEELGRVPYDTTSITYPYESVQELFESSEKTSSPIALNIDQNGRIDTLGLVSGIQFDHNNTGFAQLTDWVGPSDYLLALDRNSNGQIDNGNELFGNNTLLADGNKTAHGFQALAELDENKDGVVDANDAAFATLHLWQDANSNGITEEGELFTLEALNVASLRTSTPYSM